MMLYLAAKYEYREICVALAQLLVAHGHVVIGRWLSGVHDDPLPQHRRIFAEEDLDDIALADALVALQWPLDAPACSTGRNIEIGYALGLGKRVITIGKSTSVFFFLEQVERYQTVEDFLAVYAPRAGWGVVGASGGQQEGS